MHFSGTDIFRIYFLDKWLTCSCNFRLFFIPLSPLKLIINYVILTLSRMNHLKITMNSNI